MSQSLFNKAAVLQSATLLKETLSHVFSANFAKFLKVRLFYRTPPRDCFYNISVGNFNHWVWFFWKNFARLTLFCQAVGDNDAWWLITWFELFIWQISRNCTIGLLEVVTHSYSVKKLSKIHRKNISQTLLFFPKVVNHKETTEQVFLVNYAWSYRTAINPFQVNVPFYTPWTPENLWCLQGL